MHQNPFSTAPDPAGGAYDAPPDPLVGWGGGYPLPIPSPARRLRRLELGAYGSQAPSTQNPGYASVGNLKYDSNNPDDKHKNNVRGHWRPVSGSKMQYKLESTR